MLGKFFSHLLGNAVDEAVDGVDKLMEFEDGEWVIVNLPESGQLSVPEVDPLENLLIEHPSMSVYQIRHRVSEEEEEEEEGGSSEEEDDAPRPVAVRRHLSWRLAAWGVPLPGHLQLLPAQRARSQAERKKLSRSALCRQNMAKTRICTGDRRYGHFKQPCQRLYNY